MDDDTTLAEDLYAAVGLLRRHARRIGGRPFGDGAPAAAPTTAQLELIRLVRRNPDLSVADAAAELGLAPNTVSTLVRQLADNGVLERVRDRTDGRVVRLRLTPDTRRRVEAWLDRRTAVTARALAGIDPADRAALRRALPVLAAVAGALEQQDVSA
jgi:DNA-binding MarR family transcriptional regulator